jgi:hypothetical protein
MTIYIGFSRPFKSLFRNRIELMNEFMFSLICYMTLVFTDFSKTLEEQYLGGWFIIVMIMSFFLINMAIVLKSLIKIICLIIQKTKKVILHKFKSKKVQIKSSSNDQ